LYHSNLYVYSDFQGTEEAHCSWLYIN